MGDISIIARRIEGKKRVQYGWSGNSGYYNNTGVRLLSCYDDPELVEYLFGLGQMSLIGKPKSELGGESWFYTHMLSKIPHWLGKSEREIFSKIAFVDYGYFYDLDNIWYYIIPGPFRIKIPLMYIDQHLDENKYEFDERARINRLVAEYILGEYFDSDDELQSLINSKYPNGIDKIRKAVSSSDFPCHQIWEKYRFIYKFLDDWVVVKTNDEMTTLTGFVVKRKQSENRIETIDW